MGSGCSKSNKDVVKLKILPFKRFGYLTKTGSVSELTITNGEKFVNNQDQGFEPIQNLDKIKDQYEWGMTQPLEHIINSKEDLQLVSLNTKLNENAVHIVEPWENVGFNNNVPVRASLNIQYCLQQTTDCDSILYPLWQTGKNIPSESIVSSLEKGFACVFEGGQPDPYDKETFTHSDCPQEYLFDVYKKVILDAQKMQRCIFICLSHQLLATCLNELVKDFTSQAINQNNWGSLGESLIQQIKDLAQNIDEIGNSISILKAGQSQFKGYKDPRFSTYKNEIVEAEKQKLHSYESPQQPQEEWLTQEILDSYNEHAKGNYGILENIMQVYDNVRISMFHSSEVNQESILFNCWAFRKIRELVENNLQDIQNCQNWKWISDLPIAIEIIGCTKNTEGEVMTDSACFRVDFKNFNENSHILHYYSCQFHPELFSDLLDVFHGKSPDYKGLQQEHGVRMLLNMLTGNRI